MLKHENPNVEIINKYLWAVRFSLIPFIPQISYKPDPAVPLEQVPGQFGPDGIMILNKDYRYFEIVKKGAESVMKLKTRQIEKELDSLRKSAASGHLPLLPVGGIGTQKGGEKSWQQLKLQFKSMIK